MQESSCNPETVGGGGEQGLMQITKDKCGGAPGGNCKDPVGIQIILSSSLPLFWERRPGNSGLQDFNIGAGAKFFSETLNNNGGSLLLTIGDYNGWFSGMTYVCIDWTACLFCKD